MMIKKEWLGVTIKRKSPFNSEVFTVTITDDPEQFRLYKVLGLDVFEENVPSPAEIVEEKPKKKKKDGGHSSPEVDE